MLIVTAVNRSNLADVSDYEWVVRINQRVIAMGQVVGHVRSDGWRELIRKIAEAHDELPAVMSNG